MSDYGFSIFISCIRMLVRSFMTVWYKCSSIILRLRACEHNEASTKPTHQHTQRALFAWAGVHTYIGRLPIGTRRQLAPMSRINSPQSCVRTFVRA